MRKLLLLTTIITLCFNALADEGMWLPMHIKRLNQADMEKKGLQLTAEEIYSINNNSLKDAIVSLGGFCTAEVISKEGLMLTNHHCAYGVIQENSTVDHDYLTDGFWAQTKTEELVSPGLTARFLVRMEDVTSQIAPLLNEEMSRTQRGKIIKKLSDSLSTAATEGTHYDARVKSFYHGNEFYLFVYETFKDVRLVGAPPSSIGKFGGDTDNWMWPRHTGDFSLLRVYCGKDGKPADYSQDNVPLTPKHHLPISLDGVKDKDFTMVMGFPGRTDRFLTSHGIDKEINLRQPAIVNIRGQKLAILKEDMNADSEVRIKYAAKYAQIANYWKYFQGQTKGLKRLKVKEQKAKDEALVEKWIAKTDDAKKYEGCVTNIGEAYKNMSETVIPSVYVQEAIFGIESIKIAASMRRYQGMLVEKGADNPAIKQYADRLTHSIADHFKDYSASTDRKMMAAMLKLYSNDVDKAYHPAILTTWVDKNKGDFDKMVKAITKKTMFDSESEMIAFLEKPNAKKLAKDPVFILMTQFIDLYQKQIGMKDAEHRQALAQNRRLFTAALRKTKPNQKFAPDANSTMRLTYGQVLDYYPRDAVYYNYFTTIDGIMEKEKVTTDKNHEFYVPSKLKELYEKRDFGQYGENGKLKVCFLSNNDITGGNSGSPVINGKGQLIGCAFDGNWEAMSGDIAFEHNLQRMISVDIRYILFIIDKYAGATHIIKELTLVKGGASAQTKKPVLNKM